MQDIKRRARHCIFEFYGLKFGMTKDAVAAKVKFDDTGLVGNGNLDELGAQWIQLFFDHKDRLWQVKSKYGLTGPDEAEELLESMSRNYHFQTPSSRVAYELNDPEEGVAVFSIRYSEANLKREYFHHMMAIGAEKLAAEDGKKKAAQEEDDEYIPTGPLIF